MLIHRPMSPRKETTITTTDPDLDLDDLAHRLGVRVIEHEGGEKGRSYAGGIISLRRGLGWVARRCTLAHELAHYIRGHTPTTDPWLHSRQERQADELAAQLLITPETYETVERLAGCHAGALAQELGVTTHLIHVWRNHHQRRNT